MVCTGLSERDLLQWHDVTRKILRAPLGGPGKILGGQWPPPGTSLAPPLPAVLQTVHFLLRHGAG